MTEVSRTCFKCNATKPIDDFYRHGAMNGGRLRKCKECTRSDVRRHRLQNLEKVRAYDRDRARLPHRVEQRQARNAEYLAEHPERKVAHTAVGNAVRDGRLQKLPCAFCGSGDRVEAHHHDYTKPLDVTWLCSPCHRRFHALEQMATYEKAEIAMGDRV